MLMTAEEAKRKWCHIEVFDHCVGTDCMAWRWARSGGDDFVQRVKDYRTEHNCTLKEAKEYCEAHPVDPSTRRGFCGLAGKPEE